MFLTKVHNIKILIPYINIIMILYVYKKIIILPIYIKIIKINMNHLLLIKIWDMKALVLFIKKIY